MVFTDLKSTGLKSAALSIRDMSDGKVTPLVKITEAEGVPVSPVFSPDLRQVAYMSTNFVTSQLRVMPNEPGGKSRVLVDNPEYQFCAPAAWFPDGKSVLAILDKRDSTPQIARVTVADGGVTVLKSLPGLDAVSVLAGGRFPHLSPDGRLIAYSAATDSKDRHIYILAADGSNETEIVKTAGSNENPVWTPDGKHILFTSDRSGKFDLWSIAVQNGKAAGSASLVSAEIGDVSSIGMHGSSYYYYTYRTDAEYVNIAEFAPGATAKAVPPTLRKVLSGPGRRGLRMGNRSASRGIIPGAQTTTI